MGDNPGYTCKTCRFSSDVFEITCNDMIECRRDNPSIDGFPIIRANAWCWNGRKSQHSIDDNEIGEIAL
jgi:hypothetical protein